MVNKGFEEYGLVLKIRVYIKIYEKRARADFN